jgi:hypothetical protein
MLEYDVQHADAPHHTQHHAEELPMNRTRRSLRRTAVAVSTTLLLGTVAALPAAAYSGAGSESSGSCTKGSQWQLRADPHDGRIQVEAEVDSGVKGQHWTWRIVHNGGVAAHGKAVTKDGGSFKVQRLLINLPGTDSIGWRSTNHASGEHCSGGVKY